MLGGGLMPFKNNIVVQLSAPDYVPIIKDTGISYGGSQMWFSETKWYKKDTVLHRYGCGTIAVADLLLYLSRRKKYMLTPVTALAVSMDNQILYPNYLSYVRQIHDQYTKTLPILAVLGPSAAAAINTYSEDYGLNLQASWKWTLNYYEMYDLIEEMLEKDIPVILSIGPNTPKLWGKKGIPFYELREIDFKPSSSQTVTDSTEEVPKPYYYKTVKYDINSHYVTITGLIKDALTGRIILQISSWGSRYFINYEEYRDYAENVGGTFTSSLLHVKYN